MKGQKRAAAELLVGIDVGSTTTKIAALDPRTERVVYTDYARHNSAQRQSVAAALWKMLKEGFTGALQVAMTGSGAGPVAKLLGVPYIQEVVANSVALKRQYPEVRTAIELGGQDAKMIFLSREGDTGRLKVDDMRMNGSCAGGTGAFIDEIAAILKVPVEEFNALAEKGSCVYDISGRCGVYAKTDIQPLLNQGVTREDLALSAFHAIAKQTIGGLAQGLEIKKPVAFEGGPLTFNPALIRVFAERLSLAEEEVLIPTQSETVIARGAALSLTEMFADASEARPARELLELLEKKSEATEEAGNRGPLYFENQSERKDFEERHRRRVRPAAVPKKGEVVRAYLGIDSGSTTTKFVLLNEQGELLDCFYAPNEGEPLLVAKKALLALRDRYRRAGAEIQILAAGTTGYGEQLFASALHAECHVVETVAHARAAAAYVDDATFILDIGGQDMKAIWLDHGVITNIVINEACSSGCGSFLQNFAGTLRIPVEEIAEAAFSAQNPAVLGSRCTVFMNSSIVTEQRSGKSPEDIMAGLCRSIIENVFTKVIRVSNLDSLGDRIVVQGGTFENDAVLRAMEQYIGRPVIRAPYPGMMGAIGAALLTKEQMERGAGMQVEAMQPERTDAAQAGTRSENSRKAPTFIGLDALEDFFYEQQANDPCPFCANHCKRTVVAFSDGTSWVTNNRCERGAVLGDPKDETVRKKARAAMQVRETVPNLFETREKLLFQEYAFPKPSMERGITIGIPRVLSYWETMPFWRTFWRSLGFGVEVSSASTRAMYENGLSAVTSDTVCFPAKLVHGHIRELAERHVDRIFMPVISNVPSENTASTSESMCAVVKGYPLVIRNSDNPEKRWEIPYDAPMFYWYSDKDRNRQLEAYIKETFDISEKETRTAIAAGDQAQADFRQQLLAAGQQVLEQVEREHIWAVVLASRPYQNDRLVNHDLPAIFTGLGIPVLTADSIPGLEKVDLSRSRLDIVNNYHARMLGSAVIAAKHPGLEYVQLVSFGCGHDAYLSDEIIRMMKEISGKTPLVLKVDESDVQGPLRIRVRSFVETVAMKRLQEKPLCVHELADPYPVKYTKACVKEKIVLVPNTSHAFCRIMSAAMEGQHIRAVPLDVGREDAIRLGKKYVHNDICFPAQIVIGEALAALESGKYDDAEVAVGTGKYIGDCRLTHYGALLRKALDDAGYAHVPILTNDDVDFHNLHPGFRMDLGCSIRIAVALPMIDALEELLRKIRPYETVPGSTEAAFEKGMDALVEGLRTKGVRGAARGFEEAICLMKDVAYDRSRQKPRVLIVGEYLLNFHPGANHDIEKYLENNGFEIIEARMTDVIRKTYFVQDQRIREYHLSRPLKEKAWMRTADEAFEFAHRLTDRIAVKHPLYEPATRLPELAKESDPVIHHTFDAGEGILIPGEILHNAKKGCRNFIILQPFGCLPNHVVGRGITKRLKEAYPDAQILPLDYDPDVSFANLENRLQMLVMNARTNVAAARSKKDHPHGSFFGQTSGGTGIDDALSRTGTSQTASASASFASDGGM